MTREVQLGVLAFHSNEKLREDFYKVIRAAEGCTVDIYLIDIKAVLKRHGYDLKITTGLPLPTKPDDGRYTSYQLTGGNVCPARPPSLRKPSGHEPVMYDETHFFWPIHPEHCNPWLRACRHCGSLYLESDK